MIDKIKTFELKLEYSPEEIIEINKQFLKVCKPDVDYSASGPGYKVGYINGKHARLKRGETLHGPFKNPEDASIVITTYE